MKAITSQEEIMRKVPPHNLEAECAVLGGVFVDNRIFLDLTDKLQASDFYSPVHQMIFNAFMELSRKNKPIDMITTSEELSGQWKLDAVGGPVYLSELASTVVSAGNALHHATIVKDKSDRRRLISAAGAIIGEAFEVENITDLCGDATQRMLEITTSTTTVGLVGPSITASRAMDILDRRVAVHESITGVPTTYRQLDDMTAGLQPSDLIIIAGRPSMGKTAFALNIGLRAAIRKSKSVAFFSLEMSTDQLMQRLLCIEGEVELSLARNGYLPGSDYNRMSAAAGTIGQTKFYIDDTAALSTTELRARSRRMKVEHGLDLIIVDYLQLRPDCKKSGYNADAMKIFTLHSQRVVTV